MDATPDHDQFAGCLLGLALGDALGAPFEGGFLERALWRLIGRTREGHRRWTDDTQMAIDLAESLLQCKGLDPSQLARRFAGSYHWSRGYGRGTARTLARLRRGEAWSTAARAVEPDGSFGNGAAMRSPVLALFFLDDVDALISSARASAAVTHAHPLGIEGAVLMAVATRAFLYRAPASQVLDTVREHCPSREIREKLDLARSWLENGEFPSAARVVAALGNGTTVPASCATALYVALRHVGGRFDDMMQFVISCGGDTDTIGSMAGALWGAFHGAARLPGVAIENRARIEALASELFARAGC